MPLRDLVSMPLRRQFSKIKSWKPNSFSIVEPIFAVIGAAIVTLVPILPYALAFAAGVILIVVEEVIPKAKEEEI